MYNEYLNLTREALDAIDFEGKISEVKLFGGGIINDTFLVESKLNDGNGEKFILQRINHSIFKEVDKLMENYCNVCNYLKEIVKEAVII